MSISPPQGFPKRKHPASHIEELQPLSWDILDLPNELRFVYALQLPPHWIDIIRGLEEIDEIPPTTSLHTILRVFAPEILYCFSSVFSSIPERRSPYWIIADGTEAQPSIERLMWMFQAWLNICYGSQAVREIIHQLHFTDLQWEPLDLQQTSSREIIAGAFPSLLARYLLKRQFQFHLSDAEGHIASYPVKFAPSSGPEAEVVTWPPTSLITRKGDEYYYSYYLKFRLSSLPSSSPPRLLCQPGIRRWVSHPLAWKNQQGKISIDLAWGREKSIFVARQSASWLTQRPAETSLIRLGLRRYRELVWVGRTSAILAELTPAESIPEPLDLLTNPVKFQPQVLIVYDATLHEKHLVGTGIEEADRWETYTQLNEIFPLGIVSTPLFKKLRGFQRQQPSPAAQFPSTSAPLRFEGLRHMRLPARIEICSSDDKRCKQVILDEIGLTPQDLNGDRVKVETEKGSVSELIIVKRDFPPELIAELPPEAGEDEESRLGATRARARAIEKALYPPATENVGVLLELPNYQEYSKDIKQQRRDPKPAIVWGCARNKYKPQTFQPEAIDPETYEERLHNSVRDLLRQMDFHLNPPCTGFRETSLPSSIDLLGFWLIRLKARRRGEKGLVLPVLIHAPSHGYGFSACLPGDNGPVWLSYPQALVKIPDFTGGYTDPSIVRLFLERAIQDRGLANPTLLLVSEQNAHEILPELKDEHIQIHERGWRCALPLGGIACRIARLRYSGHGTVPPVCPTHSFGRFSGLFHDEHIPHVFYSFQERPKTAQRPTGLRQRDAQRKHSWNPSTVEIVLLNMQPEDHEHEWAWLVHRLREESSHTSSATLYPEPLYAAYKMSEYALRITDE